MLEVSNIYVSGWEASLRGMRNPLMSHIKSDSFINYKNPDSNPEIYIGPNDLKLCKALIKAGSSDRKFLRMIHVQMDITAPDYWFKEFSTYRVSVVENSSSTMHKIHSRDLTLEDFSYEHLDEPMLNTLKGLIELINYYRIRFVETKNKDNWWQIIQLLPMSYNYLRTIDLNYEVLINMYFSRRFHKLDEWHTFCDWIETLPYMKEFLSALDESIIQDELSKEHKEELIRLREKGSVKTEMDEVISPPSNTFRI